MALHMMRDIMFGKTLAADPYGLRSISGEGVLFSRGKAISSYGLFYLPALRGTGSLREGVINRQHNGGN